ncbi:MAG: carboxypeptidase regulatory-like domain-containing protein [Thermoproteota archaeon]
MRTKELKFLATITVVTIITLSFAQTLSSPSTLAPIQNALVEVSGSEGEGSAKTDAAGTFQVNEALAGGTYTIKISAKGYLTKELNNIAIEANKVKDLGDILLDASATIKGKVVDSNGVSVGPAIVSLIKGDELVYSTVSDSQGNFVFDTDIHTGVYSITAMTYSMETMQALKEGYAPGTTTGVTATEGSVTAGITVSLGVSGIISGRVTDKQGNPIKKIIVVAFQPQQEDTFFGSFAVTNDNGEYRMNSNLASGRYNVTISFPKGYIWTYTKVLQVDVQAGQETRDVNFQLESSGIISGKVVYGDGKPADHVVVSTFSSDGKYWNINVTDAEGNFMFDSNLGPGEYTITANKGILTSEPKIVQLESGGEVSGIVLTIDANIATIIGTVTDDQRKPLEDATVSAQVFFSTSVSTDESGKYNLPTWFMGSETDEVQVTASKKGYEAVSRSITVEAGGTYTLDFQLLPRPWGTVKGRVMSIVTKKVAELSISLSSPSTHIGGSVVISGSLSPARTGSVTIYASFDGEPLSKLAEAELSNGQYSYTFMPDRIGTYTVKADWPGDDEYNSAESGAVSLSITKITPSISLSLSSTNVNIDESVTASGTISPFYGTTVVTLSITGPAGTSQVDLASTDGTFSHSFTANAEGTWRVQASIPASENYNEATSTEVSVQAEKKCIIATVTFGSELAPEVNFLRGFRNDLILKTYAGSRFYIAFDAFYYSWSTPVAMFIKGNEGIKTFTKIMIYPLIGSLQLTAYMVMPWFTLMPEVAAVVAGFIASSLIGLIYFFIPVLGIRHAFRRIMKPVTKRFLKYCASFVLLTIPTMAIGIYTNFSTLTTIAASLYVLGNIVLTTSTVLYILERKLYIK